MQKETTEDSTKAQPRPVIVWRNVDLTTRPVLPSRLRGTAATSVPHLRTSSIPESPVSAPVSAFMGPSAKSKEEEGEEGLKSTSVLESPIIPKRALRIQVNDKGISSIMSEISIKPIEFDDEKNEGYDWDDENDGDDDGDDDTKLPITPIPLETQEDFKPKVMPLFNDFDISHVQTDGMMFKKTEERPATIPNNWDYHINDISRARIQQESNQKKGIISSTITQTRAFSLTGYGVVLERTCILCGKQSHEHYKARHTFVGVKEEHKCAKCGKYFYQHDHKHNSCYTPIRPVE